MRLSQEAAAVSSAAHRPLLVRVRPVCAPLACCAPWQLLNEQDADDTHHVLRMFDFFYFKEHLFIVCELLRDNLYELYKYISKSDWTPYFTLPRIRSIAHQCLTALAYIHSLDLIHCDLKPENILIKSLSRCVVKVRAHSPKVQSAFSSVRFPGSLLEQVIDFGSSCFTRDPHSSYVQSRSYRAPEVPVRPLPSAPPHPHVPDARWMSFLRIRWCWACRTTKRWMSGLSVASWPSCSRRECCSATPACKRSWQDTSRWRATCPST